ncbi:MAG: hypothetical protein LQ345_001647 [Seirophora villosa]|nr:MAG: hypothetical protein LQ345_001647 [Seirophora villosa]
MSTTPPLQSSPRAPNAHQPPSLTNSPLTKRPKIMDAPLSSTADGPPPMTTNAQSPPLLIKKLSASAKVPTRGSAFAAGYDIYASKPTSVPGRGKALVETDIAISVPEGTCGYPAQAPADHHQAQDDDLEMLKADY